MFAIFKSCHYEQKNIKMDKCEGVGFFQYADADLDWW